MSHPSPCRWRPWTLALTATVAIAGATFAAPKPVADPFQVNLATRGDQRLPDVAALDGSFLVVWQDDGTPPGSVIRGRHVGTFGPPVEGDLVLPGTDVYPQRSPRVAVTERGTFVVLWQSNLAAGGYVERALRARVFLADATPAHAPFVVASTNSYVGATIFASHDVEVANDSFVVSLTERPVDVPAATRHRIVRMSDDGTLKGGVDLGIMGGFGTARLRRGTNGTFVVSQSAMPLYATGVSEVGARRLDANGDLIGPLVSWPTTDSYNVGADAALGSDGAFLVVWHASDGYSPTTIRGRAVSASDLPLGSELVISASGTGNQTDAQIARGGGGTYLVVWQSDGASGATDTSGTSIRARHLSADGVPIGDSFQVNDLTSGDQSRPVVSVSRNGATFMVAWQSESSDGGDTDGWSIRGRRYATSLVRFVDGFESGSTGAWDTTVP